MTTALQLDMQRAVGLVHREQEDEGLQRKLWLSIAHHLIQAASATSDEHPVRLSSHPSALFGCILSSQGDDMSFLVLWQLVTVLLTLKESQDVKILNPTEDTFHGCGQVDIFLDTLTRHVLSQGLTIKVVQGRQSP